MSLPLLFGREGEHTINIVPRKGYKGELPSEDDLIGRMQALLIERFGAVPFGSIFGRMSIPDTLKLLRSEDLGEYGFDTRIIQGVYLPALGRFYREVLREYFEVSTVLHSNPFGLYGLVRHGEKIIGHLARQLSTQDYQIICHNSVSDRKGINANSCGMHGNHLRSRDLFERVMRREFPNTYLLRRPAQDFISFLVLRPILTGEGKIGADCGRKDAFYQISARADFECFLMDEGTAVQRPIINTRDEQHADWSKYSRFHVINSEGNRSPWAFAYDLGLTSIFLAALDDDAINLSWYLEYPVATLHKISRDLLFKEEYPAINRETSSSSSMRALDMFAEMLRPLELYVARRSGLPSWCNELVGEAQESVALLKRGDYQKAQQMLDWAIKFKFIEEYVERGLRLNSDSWSHVKVKALDIGYHHIHNEWAWERAKERRDIRDADKYDPPDDDITNFWSWSGEEPKDSRNFLIWLMLRDPHLRNRTRIIDWALIKFWEKDPQKADTFSLRDPQYFDRAHLTELLQGDFDFSTPSKRRRLKEVLMQHAKASDRDMEELVLEEQRETDKIKDRNLTVSEPVERAKVDFPAKPPHTKKRTRGKDRGEWI